VVDDATLVRLYYRQILTGAGYHVAEAINGLEGLERLNTAPFDLCIVDVNMPMMDGYGFIHAMRRESSIHAIPVMMTSTEAGPRDRTQAWRAGANAYLVKPVAREQLLLYVAAMLGSPPT
jgi:two-component system chemotaxis response regulator CheY